jgi:hypothetical protein
VPAELSMPLKSFFLLKFKVAILVFNKKIIVAFNDYAVFDELFAVREATAWLFLDKKQFSSAGYLLFNTEF